MSKKGTAITKRMLKRKNVIITTLVSIIVLLIGAFSCTLTWFAKLNSMNLDIGGSVLSEYFDSGDGTEENPFVITRPKHWENLVWLHNNVSNFYQAITDGSEPEGGLNNGKGYYFQVGKKNSETPEDETLYVYDYTNEGLINPENNQLNARVLNLNGLTSLIPIGSSAKPFIGELTSDGITVSGFDVLGFEDRNNNLTQDTGEEGFNDVGIFGYVGEDSLISNIYFDNFTIHLANSDPNGAGTNNDLHNTTFHDTDANDTLDKVYVGYIAGHVHYASVVQGVYINNCKMDGGSAALSGFSYFGLAENQDGTPKPTPMEEIKATKLAGDGNSFGGSVDFYSVYDRLARIYSSTPASSQTKYVSAETIIKNDVTESEEIFAQTKSNVVGWYTSSGKTYSYRYAETESGGVFNFPDDNDAYGSTSADKIYQCLYGESTHYTKTVTTYTFIDDWYDCFFIQNGTNYLNDRYYAELRAVTNENQAAGWRFDASNHLYTKVFDVTYYLNRSNYVLTVGTSANTTWTKTNEDEIYTVINGVNFYLDYEDTWCLSPYKDRYIISDGNTNYLTASTSTVSNSQNESGATKWFKEESGTSVSFGTNIGNQIYYLSNSDDQLTMSTTKKTWTKEDNYYYTTVGGVKLYIVYENNQWLLRPEEGVRISNGSGTYLSTSGTTINSTTVLNNACMWYISSTTGDTQIYCLYNNTKYYLNYNNGLVVNTTAATWHRNGNGIYITNGNIDYYLIYQSNQWKVVPLEYYLIHDESGTNYLRITGTSTFGNTTNITNATHFYFSDLSGTYPTGTINFSLNNTIYYLNVSVSSNTGSLSCSTSSSTSWSNDGTSIYYKNGNYTYYLEYNGGWKIRTYVDGYCITDGTNYLTLSGSTIGNTTNASNATVFIFSNTSGSNPSGNISAIGGTRYLRDNNGTFTTTTSTSYSGTSWTNDGSKLKSNQSTNRYLYFSGSAWALSTTTSVAATYYISYSNTYLGTNGTSINTSQTEWVVAGRGGTGPIYTVINETTYYLSQSNNTAVVSSSSYDWYNGSTNRLRAGSSSGRYLYYDNGWKTSSTRQNLTFTTASSKEITTYTRKPVNNIVSTIAELQYDDVPSITMTNYTINKNMTVSEPIAVEYGLNIFNTQLQNCEKDIENNVKSGNPTYFPLRVDKDENGNYPSGYAVSEKNTGYLVSGANLTQSGQAQWGDIRVAGWSTDNISNSYSGGGFRTIYTVGDNSGNEIRELTTAEKQDPTYTAALEQFGNALSSSGGKVYGVHFMDAAISKEHTIRANQATILGKTYYNYELPEDSIDFNVYQRGKISFFAGEYFTNNNTFFSLHRIFRNEKNDIEEIKEIVEIYDHAQKHDKANYIYKFSDDTYTNANGTYTGATTKDSLYSTNPVFKTSWITSPNGLDSNNGKRLFFFSIPCNAGEYALGSVSGRNGAYLCYLDIAANGGDTKLEEIKTVDTVTTFNVDYRSANETTDHSILQLGAELPAATSSDDFSITVNFDSSAETCEGTEYSSGLYTIYIVNKTSELLEISILVIDDNDDLYDDFHYAYRVIYTNNDYTEEIIECTPLNDPDGESKSYWQRLAIFEIPPDGEGAESDYTD